MRTVYQTCSITASCSSSQRETCRRRTNQHYLKTLQTSEGGDPYDVAASHQLSRHILLLLFLLLSMIIVSIEALLFGAFTPYFSLQGNYSKLMLGATWLKPSSYFLRMRYEYRRHKFATKFAVSWVVLNSLANIAAKKGCDIKFTLNSHCISIDRNMNQALGLGILSAVCPIRNDGYDCR